MPVPVDAVGAQTPPITHDVDNRWVMAYAASLGDFLPCYLDTTRDGGVVSHPLFPVCVEWPTMLAMRDLPVLTAAMEDDEARRGVHATHDLVIERLIVPGDRLTTSAVVTGVEQRRPGAYLTCEMTTVDASGAVVCRTTQGSLYLGVATQGEDRPPPPAEAVPAWDETTAPAVEQAVAIGAGDAHTYTECARIWNPIHTDVAVARRATLGDIILHGTATLAHAVSVGVRAFANGDPSRVRRIRGRFAAMVAMPSTITVAAHADGRFQVSTSDGRPAISHGHITLG